MTSFFRSLSGTSETSEAPLLTVESHDPLGANVSDVEDDEAITFDTPEPIDAVDKASRPGPTVPGKSVTDYSTLYGGVFKDVTLPERDTIEREEMEQRFKAKIDMAILPVVIAMYMMNFLDRNNIAAAKLSTLVEDLDMTSVQYSSCISVLYFGYILMQIPSNLILEKVGHPSIYLPTAMVIWGVLSTMTAFVHGYRSLVSIRFFIGFAEAAFYPGTVFYLSCWYTKYEIAKRSAIFVCGSSMSGAFSGFVAYGVLDHLDGVFGFAAWRWLFLIEGLLTVTVALIAMFTLPNLPATTTWLSKEERLLGVVRMVEDVGQQDDDSATSLGHDNTRPQSKLRSALSGFYMAVRDKKVFIILGMMFSFAVTSGINSVFPTIVNSLGFGRQKTLLLTAPPWVLCSITSVMNSIHSDQTGERYLHMMWGPCLSLLGFAFCILSTNTGIRYIAMLLLLQISNSWSLGFAWMASTIPRPPIKRAAAVAIINLAANIPNTIVPYLFYQGSEPQFYLGFIVCGGFTLVGMFFATLLKSTLLRLNKKLERGAIIDGLDGSTGFQFIY